MTKPNMEIDIRHKITGCGTRLLCFMELDTYKELKELLSLPGLDIELQAVEYPYKSFELIGETIQHKKKGRRDENFGTRNI